MLWRHLDKRRQRQFFLLLVLMILASISEVISIGSVLPFIGILTSPEQVYQHAFVQPFIQEFNLTNSNQLILPFTIVFIIATLVAGTIRLILLFAMVRFSYALGADLSIEIYRRTLYQEYSIHASRNSSEIINGIISKTNTVIGSIVTPILTIASSFALFIGIIATLFAINVLVALSAIFSFGVLYLGVILYTKRSLAENSQCIAKQSTQLIKSLQEGLGGIRDVLIDGSQKIYCKIYRDADVQLRRAAGNNQFIAGSPKYIMEALGMVLIAILSYFMTRQEQDVTMVIPVLAALALGAQKLLPTIQQAYDAYSNLRGGTSSFEDVLNLLSQPLPTHAGKTLSNPIPFVKEIRLENISFRYSNQLPWIFKNINLTIKKSSVVGFKGTTGSGKSTLLDIVMGLLSPTNGSVLIDGQRIDLENKRSWQVHITHVPQNIFLSDNSIEENIALGIPKEKINQKRVRKAARQAQISGLIDSWSDGYQTFVGERGIRLSGGQRQRIGIARALYKKADVLIFDEATSALDDKTEQAVMNVIDKLRNDLTILIIAHRLSTLKSCSQIIDLSDNRCFINKGS